MTSAYQTTALGTIVITMFTLVKYYGYTRKIPRYLCFDWTHEAVDEEVDGRVDGHEQEGDGRHHHDPEGQKVAAGVAVVTVLPESVDPEELVEVQENPRIN